MKRFIGIMIVLVLNTFAAAAQNTPENVMPLVYVTEPADDQSGSPNFDLYVMNPQTDDILFKSTTPQAECPIAISPDGEWLLYQQNITENDQIQPTHRLVNLKTGSQRQIDVGGQLLSRDYTIWSNTDSFFFFVYKKGDNRIYKYDLITDSAMEVAHSESFIHLMQLGTEVVYWSADDRKLLVNDLNGDSYEMDYSELFAMGTPSPDGHFIVRKINKEQYRDKNGLLLYNYDYILSGLDYDNHVTISDDHRNTSEFPLGLIWRSDSKAVFYFDLDRNFVVYDLVSRQKTLFPALDISDLQNLSGNWSPDGRYVAYTVDYGYVSHHNQIELGLIDTTTGEISPISSYDDNEYRAGFIQWIDDHQFVYLSGNPGYDSTLLHTTSSDIIKYDVTTKTFINLTNTPDLIEGKECRISVG